MLRRAVREGTGRNAAIPGVEVAGKTGTAQRALAGGGGYAEDEYVSSFVGFLPATQQPRYLCLVVVENPRIGKWGGTVAAPAFRRTMERVLALEDSQLPVAVTVPQAAIDAAPAPDVVPDLRGMDVVRARGHAERRDLTVHFTGAGDLVVEQMPAPRTTRVGDVITCRLGSADDIFPLALADAPIRQAVLMRKLRGRHLVALAR
jgi:membrane peptidoglycan carboxypeptidase